MLPLSVENRGWVLRRKCSRSRGCAVWVCLSLIGNRNRGCGGVLLRFVLCLLVNFGNDHKKGSTLKERCILSYTMSSLELELGRSPTSSSASRRHRAHTFGLLSFKFLSCSFRSSIRFALPAPTIIQFWIRTLVVSRACRHELRYDTAGYSGNYETARDWHIEPEITFYLCSTILETWYERQSVGRNVAYSTFSLTHITLVGEPSFLGGEYAFE